MSFIQTENSTASSINLYYQDWGAGQPVVLIHGWPLSHEMWEYQLTKLPANGIRCVTYDRRGFGKSDRTLDGYDYTTLAEDLKSLLDELDLENVTLVGFSMGGGEVVRYFSQFGGERVSKVVLLSSVTPLLLKTETNPDGVEKEAFNEFDGKIREDRPDFLKTFGKIFYGVNFIKRPVSEGILEWSYYMALNGSSNAILECMKSFSETDFRDEMHLVNVPTLIIHGNNDKVVPIKATSEQAKTLIPNAEFIIYDDAPHGLFYTHKDQLNDDLLSFIRGGRVRSKIKTTMMGGEPEVF